MKTKTVGLVLILTIPVLVFLFLQFFGKNHFTIPILGPRLGVNSAGDTIYHTIPEFHYIDHKGNPFSSNQLKNQVYLVDFFFTTCPDICPKMTSQLTRVHEAFSSKKDFKIVSITVDPSNDSVSVLDTYATKYGARYGDWFFLTGAADSIYALARKHFLISAMPEEDSTGFVHSDKLILIDKNGRIRGYYNGTDTEDVDRAINEINVLYTTYQTK